MTTLYNKIDAKIGFEPNVHGNYKLTKLIFVFYKRTYSFIYFKTKKFL